MKLVLRFLFGLLYNLIKILLNTQRQNILKDDDCIVLLKVNIFFFIKRKQKPD